MDANLDSCSNLSVLVISFSDLRKDPRVFRQLQYLKSRGYSISTLGEGRAILDGIESKVVEPLSRSQKLFKAIRCLFTAYDQSYWGQKKVKDALKIFSRSSFDIIIANDISALPLALKLSKGAKVYFDAHEYAPKEFEDRWLWRFLFQGYQYYLCRKYMKEADCMTTVCRGISDEYEKVFNVKSEIVTNAASYQDLPVRKVEEGRIKMIYHGVALPSRGIDEVVKVMDLLDERFYLDMILVPGNIQYINHIKKCSQNISRLRFLDPVEMKEIPSLCNQYDIGFYPLKLNGLNAKFSLPNKFFEFIQARNALVTFPMQEMKYYLDKFACGVCSDDFTIESIAKKLNSLDANSIFKMKEQSDSAAKILNAQKNYEILDALFSKLRPSNQIKNVNFGVSIS